MAIENLMPIQEVNSKRTREQHSADSRKAGIRSGEVRRERATMRAVLESMLNETPKGSNLTYRQMATLGLIKGAVKGNAQNYKTIVETMGELFAQEENKSSGVIVELIEALNNAKK